jgi:putative transcriptional regulator
MTGRADRCEVTRREDEYTRQDGVVTEESLTGRLLVATPALREPTFARTVIAMLEHGETTGAIGVVINRTIEAPIADVLPSVADLASGPAVLFDGGPVAPQTAIALGMVAPGAEPDGWSPVGLSPAEGIAPPLVTVDLDHDPALLAATLTALRVFVGYAGGSPGPLEGEIAEGSWYVVDRLPHDCFTADPDRLWSAVLHRQPWPLSAVAVCPLDPSMN